MTTYMLHINTTNYPGYPFWEMGAAGKCHFDRETFAQEIGIKIIDGFAYTWDDEPRDVLNSRLDGILGGLKQNDAVIVQWPFFAFKTHWIQTFIDRVHQFRSKLIFLIDDISSWRVGPELPSPDSAELPIYLSRSDVSEEINFISQADGVIFHSAPMHDHFLEEMALAGKTLTQNVTYYGPGGHGTAYFQGRRQPDQGVDYAGTLFKAPFLKKLPSDFKINVYGAEKDDAALAEHQNISLHKRVDPQAMPQMLEGSYGLIWDSEQYPGVVGSLGEYEKYNTPAKFPMYLSADEPVIVWSRASTAPFVEANKIGLVVDSLAELPEQLASITTDQYNQMLDNVLRISPLIRSGFFLKKAIFEVLGLVYDNNLTTTRPDIVPLDHLTGEKLNGK